MTSNRAGFKLLSCSKDKPGVMLKMLYAIMGKQIGINAAYKKKDEKRIIEPSIHMFTLKRCERFTPWYFHSIFAGRFILMRPKYLFHFIIQLKEVRSSGKTGSDNRKIIDEKEDTIGILEVHMCLNGDEYGISVSVLKDIVESISAPSLNEEQVDNKDFIACKKRGSNEDKDKNKHDNIFFIPRIIIEDRGEGDESILNFGLLIPLSDDDDKGLLKKLHRRLSRVTGIGNNDICPERGTCPLAFVQRHKENFSLYSDVIISGQNYIEGEDKGSLNAYILFARDHECYIKGNTFVEYYGMLFSKDKNETGSNNERSSVDGFIYKPNAMIIRFRYIRSSEEKIVEKYINKMLKRLYGKDLHGKIITKYHTKRDERAYYVYKKNFVCDNIKCEVSNKVLPELSIKFIKK